MPTPSVEEIRQYREKGLSLRKIAELLNVSHTAVWSKLSGYHWNKTENGKVYNRHRYHIEIKEDCIYCEFEKRKASLHSQS